jgi:hypothetical protein
MYDRDERRALVNTILNFLVTYRAEISLAEKTSVSAEGLRS